MGCGCGSSRRAQQPYVVKMPNGELKSYSSEIAAKAKVKATPGAELMPRGGASV